MYVVYTRCMGSASSKAPSIALAVKEISYLHHKPCAPPSTSWAGRRVVDLSFGYNDRTVYWDEDGRFRINATVQSNDVEDWCVQLHTATLYKHKDERTRVIVEATQMAREKVPCISKPYVSLSEKELRVLVDEISTPTHGGTHMDAPRHFSKIGWSASEIPLDRLLMVPIALIDVQAEAARNASYLMPVAEVLRWEAQNGLLPYNCLLLIRSGWSKVRTMFGGTPAEM
ncbi:hypothetical protein HPB51_022589 [Rhipicephalus microplus]|uniref:Uncharacterized protein n=1 Tax=Rhipicephalus microplus TaxID=6941 RepID=A0A9J6DX42_RHIMP|nr:hypothetical protein HPB51_022589 [Rhipicephalus microplus]